jgi:large subunit ribosomal protein L35
MAKIKVKTNKGAAKRFKVTASGKVMRNRSGKSHLNVKKSRKRKRRLISPHYIDGVAAKRIRKLIPYL